MGKKICGSCKEELDVKMFGVLSASKDGLRGICKICFRRNGKKSYYKNHETIRIKKNKAQNTRYWLNHEKSKKYARDARRKVRLEILEIYGGKCCCCGTDEESFLTLDHIEGSGNKHRREVGNNSNSVYRSVQREGCPKTKYQILCFNCNRSKFVLGACAHILYDKK